MALVCLQTAGFVICKTHCCLSPYCCKHEPHRLAAECRLSPAPASRVPLYILARSSSEVCASESMRKESRQRDRDTDEGIEKETQRDTETERHTWGCTETEKQKYNTCVITGFFWKFIFSSECFCPCLFELGEVKS
jgi:hypothetical protein